MIITMIIFVSGLEILKILTKNNLNQVGMQYEHKQSGLGRFPANCQPTLGQRRHQIVWLLLYLISKGLYINPDKENF